MSGKGGGLARRSGTIGVRLLGALCLAAAAAPASAGLVIMARSDKGDVIYSLNETNPVARLKARSQQKGGTWKIIHASRACGYFAVWSATNESERKYFVATGKASAFEASKAASEEARGYAKGRKGWYAVIYRVNVNRCPGTLSSAGDPVYQVKEPEKSITDQALDYIKGKIRSQVTNGRSRCAPERSDDGKSARAHVRMPYESPWDRNLPGAEPKGSDQPISQAERQRREECRLTTWGVRG